METSRTGTSPSSYERGLAVVFIVAFALDFKGNAGGTAIQSAMAVVSATSFLLLAVRYNLALPRRGVTAAIVWVWVSLLVVGSLSAVIYQVPSDRYIRTAYNFLLFLQGFLVVWWTGKKSKDIGWIVSAMVAASVASLVFTFAFGFAFSGLGTAEIRYQILSPVMPFLVVALGCDVVLFRRRVILALGLLAVAFVAIALSVTRTEVMMIGGVACTFGAVVVWAGLRRGRVSSRLLGAAMMVGVLACVVVALVYLSGPQVGGRWIQRTTDATHDVTVWTRVAAVTGQIDVLNDHAVGWIVGMGFGNSYPWPVDKFPWIVPYLGRGVGRSVWFPGEFMWVPFLFYGGVVIGSTAIFVLLVGVWHALRVLSTQIRNQTWNSVSSRAAWIGALGYLAFVWQGFTSNPFITRSAALFMGMCMALVVINRSKSKAQKLQSTTYPI